MLRSLYVILNHGGVLKSSQEEQQKSWTLAAYLSAVVHDYEHRGVNVSEGFAV